MKRKLLAVMAVWLQISVTAFPQNNTSHSPNHQKANKKMNTTASLTNKEVIHNLYENVFNERKWELLTDIISDEYTGQQNIKGINGFKEPVQGIIKALPDARWTIKEILAEGSKVIVLQKLEGTQTEPFQFIPATGKKISNEGMAIFELKDGKIIKSRVQTDQLGFLQQLEVLPSDLSILVNKKSGKDQVYFIDKFIMPAASKNEFMEQMNYNKHFIRKIPGFAGDETYMQTDANGNVSIITIAVWENEKALQKAKEAVQEEYKRVGFNPQDFYKRLNIQLERNNYQKIAD